MLEHLSLAVAKESSDGESVAITDSSRTSMVIAAVFELGDGDEGSDEMEALV
jgi:hypothetical protein